MKKLVDVKNLHVSLPSSKKRKNLVNIIRGIDFEINKNQIVGFIGESGSGKSVTAKTLLGINPNATTKADKIEIDSINVLTPNNLLTKKRTTWQKIRGKKVAYIPQDSLTSLNPTKRIGDQITEAIKIHSPKKQTSAERKKEAIDILEKFGIKNAEKKLRAYPHEFSGGMRQRVVIAMMIVCKPSLIIADEPTTALDPTIQSSVLSLFQEIVRTMKISILFISHDISVIAALCNYLYVFYAGAIVEKGTKKEMFTNPKHPYTWSLLSAIPDSAINKKGTKLFSIPGQPPSFEDLPKGDPFSIRNPYAMKIDFQKEAPLFKITKTHYAATWLLHPSSPKVKLPKNIEKLIKITSEENVNEKK